MASAPDSSPVFVLNVHADYQCRHEGACCTAGWHIPIEPDRFTHLRAALNASVFAAPGSASGGAPSDIHASCFSADEPPDGAAAIVNLDPIGACVFLDRQDGNLCAIQRACGQELLPATCQQFPRVALIDARGTHLTLSHFCPTAARMLFRDDVDDLSIVVDPSGPIRRDTYEGFDATATIPPLVRPGLVSDAEVAVAWDAFVMRTLGSGSVTPEAALMRMIGAAERIRNWKPGSASLAATARGVCDEAMSATERDVPAMAPTQAARLFLAAAATVPTGLRMPRVPEHFKSTHARWIAPARLPLSRPIRRYLAAKGFAAWSAYCGEGLRTQIAMLAVALGVLEIESTRLAAAAGRALDLEMLLEAIRQADFLLVHLASGEDMVRRMGRVETMTREAYVAELGLEQV